MSYDSSRFSLTSEYPGAGSLSGFSLNGPAVTYPQSNYSAGGQYANLSVPAASKGTNWGSAIGGGASLLSSLGGLFGGGGSQTPEQQMFQMIHQGRMSPIDVPQAESWPPPDDILRALLAQLLENR